MCSPGFGVLSSRPHRSAAASPTSAPPLCLSPPIPDAGVDMGSHSQPPSPCLSSDGDVDAPALQLGEQQLVSKISAIYDSISKLPTLEPSKEVNELFSQLVLTCIPPSPIDVALLGGDAQEMRWRLIRLCGVAEGLLESHYSALLGSFPAPLDHVALFPYYNNYVELGFLEYTILRQHAPARATPARVAFVGSGPLPLTSIVLARDHLRSTTFHNYDFDPEANAKARRLVAPDPDLSGRMFFHTADIMEVTHALRDYDVVFLAALVGMGAEEKARVLEHLAKYMAPGAVLMVRSAHGARAFLYPVVDPCSLRCFDVLAVHHPVGEVINSVVIARKIQSCGYPPAGHSHRILPCKCACTPFFNPLSYGNKMEEMALEEQAS